MNKRESGEDENREPAKATSQERDQEQEQNGDRKPVERLDRRHAVPILFSVHQEGWPFIALFAAATILLFLVAEVLGYIGLALTVWCVCFFRDPERVTPKRPGLVVSPADGVVQMITTAPPPAELGMGTQDRIRVSVFMNVFNVHVNRVPADGTIASQAYHPGKFLNATLDKASLDNERHGLRLTLPDGGDMAFVQIAGLVARRIKCWVKDGQEVKAGQRFGMIRFGSRVDVYLPVGVSPLVDAGQTMVAGETVIADLRTLEEPYRGEPHREGEVR